MSTVAEFRAYFRTYNPSGGGREEWNMWCQAFVSRMSKFGGGFVRDYETARAARLASGWLNPDLNAAPVGAIGYWLWGTDDHVAVYEGGGVWLMGSRHITDQFGGVARNAGRVSHADFQRSAGLTFLGWSATNGGNTVSVSTMFPDQRRTLPNVRAVVRAGVSRQSKNLGTLEPNTIYTFAHWALGESVEGLNLWYGDKVGHWFHCSSFQLPHTVSGLPVYVAPTPPPVVVVPPVVVPPVEPEPEPEPVEPEPVPVEPEPTPDPIEPTPIEPAEPEPTPEPEIPAPKPAPNWSAAIVAFFAALAKIINKITGRKDTE